MTYCARVQVPPGLKLRASLSVTISSAHAQIADGANQSSSFTSENGEEYAGFSAQRKAPVFCGEFGCNNFAVENTERVGWYRLVAGLLDEYSIPRISWDYFGSFGLFFEEPGKRPRFPEDLNLELLDALKLKRP